MNTENILEIRNKVAEIIQRIRVQKNLTLEAVSKEIGISSGTLRRIENGTYSPSSDQLYTILNYYKIEMVIAKEKII